VGDSESTFSAPPAYAYWVDLVNIVVFYLQIGVMLLTLYAFVHAAMQRPDAYTAADKMTKPVWLVILGVALPVAYLFSVMGAVAAACAAGVYLVDVRPKLLEIQGKSR
jgi:4-amino-4-deoxy-L-arabinose transferase-like glycosyltransferase